MNFRMKERKMWIDKLHIENYRAFQKPFDINLSKNLTVIAGMNGVGKSTILAILTNVGELPTKYKTISGSQFRGEFSDVIMYDKEHDVPGDKVKIHFTNLPDDPQAYNVIETLQFRATKQTGQHKKYIYHKLKGDNGYERTLKTTTYPRYRLIPKKTKEHNNEKKILWPSLYLGLSRLAPLGEYDTATKKEIPEKISKEIIDAHAEILAESFSDENTELANLDIGVKHQKSEIKTKNYSFESNSSGQDNTGQIIESVLSFEILKDKLGDKYIGGILAVDEIDATLHPAAQNRLIDWLLRKSEELDLQIVFTTHSLTLLEHISQKQKNNAENIIIDYLSSSSSEIGTVRVKENPVKNYYRYNLQESYAKVPSELPTIKIMSEDETARWFLDKLVNILGKGKTIPNYEKIDTTMSWTTLVNLLNADPENYKDYIFILDPDTNIENENSEFRKYLENNYVSFKVNNVNSNLLILPGSYAIEKELWMYVNNLDDENPIFSDPILENAGVINTDIIRKMNEFDQKELFPNSPSGKIQIGPDSDSEHYKLWFRYIALYRNIFVKYWIKDNLDQAKKFIGLFEKICKRIRKEGEE